MINFRNFFTECNDRNFFIELANRAEEAYIEENGKTFSRYNQVFNKSSKMIWGLYRYQTSVIFGTKIGKDAMEHQDVATYIHNGLHHTINLQTSQKIVDAFINIGLLNVIEKEEDYQLENYKFGIKHFFCKFPELDIYDFEEFKMSLEFKDINESDETLKDLYYNYIFNKIKKF